MSLLERVIIAHRCRSTHHYIAMDALPLLTGSDAEKWRNLILVHNEELLKGAKAPDAVFKDFKNHVLHVGEGEWGGARDAAMAWYAEAVGHLQEKKWAKAVYALGVLSHYYADPIQPFHTGQTEEEGTMHRAVEWSIAKSRTVIKERIEEIGYPTVEAGEGTGFVSDMVRAGAEKSHPHYQTLLDHYNLDVGAKNPPAGLDQTLIDVISELVAYATAGLSVLFSRAFAEAGVAAPNVHITVPGYLATLDIPVHWVSKKLDDAGDKRTVTAMYNEYRKTGKVIKKLPDDDKQIRKIHARQVTRRPLKELDAQPLKPIGQSYKPRPQYVEFAKKIAESLAPKTEEARDLKASKKPIEKTTAKAEKPSKKSKRTSSKKSKPKVRIAAAISEAEAVTDSLVETVEKVDTARLEKETAERLAAEALAKKEAEDAARAEQERLDAEEFARLEAEEAEAADREAAEKLAKREAEDAERAEQERLEAEELARIADEEEAQFAAEEQTKREAQEALRFASEERARLAEEEKLRLEAEEFARIEAEEAEAERVEAQEAARFEAREAAEFERLEAEEAAELARMEAEEEARIAAEDAEAAENTAAETDDEEFSLEELAAFDTNLTDNGDVPAEPKTAPPVESFFESSDGGGPTRSRTRLMPEDQVVDAPSIGKKTARRLNRVGVFTVDDLLNCNSEEIAFELDVRHIDEPTLEDWKAQARLMIEVPGLRIHDTQILVGAGVRSAEDLANASASRIFHASMGFLKSSKGSRVVRDDHVLHETEVDEWIGLAKDRGAA